MEQIHGICIPQTRSVKEVGGGPTTYLVSFPRLFQEVKCPVTGFPEVAHSSGRLRKHFMCHHFRSKVMMFQDRAEPLPPFDLCGLHMPARRVIKHQRTACYDKNTQMSWRRRDVAIVDRCLEATFSLTGEVEAECIEGVKVFKYLRRLLG